MSSTPSTRCAPTSPSGSAGVGVLAQGAQARELLLDKLLESTDVPLPESAVKAERDWREHDVVHQLEHNEANLARYLDQQGKTREEFDADLQEAAERGGQERRSSWTPSPTPSR